MPRHSCGGRKGPDRAAKDQQTGICVRCNASSIPQRAWRCSTPHGAGALSAPLSPSCLIHLERLWWDASDGRASQQGATWQTGQWTHTRFIHSVAKRRKTRMTWSPRTQSAGTPPIRIESGAGSCSAAPRTMSAVWHMPCLHVANALDLQRGRRANLPKSGDLRELTLVRRTRRSARVQRPTQVNTRQNAGSCASVFGTEYAYTTKSAY